MQIYTNLCKFCKFLQNEPIESHKLANKVGFELVLGKLTEITKVHHESKKGLRHYTVLNTVSPERESRSWTVSLISGLV